MFGCTMQNLILFKLPFMHELQNLPGLKSYDPRALKNKGYFLHSPVNPVWMADAGYKQT